MRKSILVIGSSNTDMIIKSERFPDPGETILGGDFYMLPGGKGANQAVAAARLGGEVSFICRVGDDLFGKRSIQVYEEERISTDNIIVDPKERSGVALISVNGDGENKIVVASGANNGFKEEEIENVYKIISRSDYVIMQLEIPVSIVGKIIQFSKQTDTNIILNPAPAQKLPDWFFEDLFLVTPNETETEILTGINVSDELTAKKAALWFQNKGVRNVVITLGKNGSYLVTSNEAYAISTPNVNTIDSTAAGDVFNGALAVALANGQSFKEAVNFASIAAALSVKKIGAQSSCPTLEDVWAFSQTLVERNYQF